MEKAELYQQAKTIIARIQSGDRVALGKTITLIESTKASHQRLTAAILDLAIQESGETKRIAISGAPGVGKSTFIEAFGQFLVAKGYKISVLTIDPSSQLSGGSILGDKTRMEHLATNPNAFVRPSAAGQYLGGVSANTRESMLLCEIAGYDITIVETVGVGQSETEASEMVDFFILLIAPGAGDALQGIKRGIVELADMIIINKADGDRLPLANQTMAHYKMALHLFQPKSTRWDPVTHTCSALEKRGLDNIWSDIEKYYAFVSKSNTLSKYRKAQKRHIFEERAKSLLHAFAFEHPEFQQVYQEISASINKEKLSVSGALQELENHLKLIFKPQ